MDKKIEYPTAEQIIEYNILALTLIRIKKADTPIVLSKSKLLDIIEDCEELSGDIYDKAICLMKGIIQKHPFGSGNRRTAFIVVKDFLLSNNTSFKVKDDPIYAKVMQGIRENFYSNDEIKEWLKHGEIKDFKR